MEETVKNFLAGILTIAFAAHPFVLGYLIFSPSPKNIFPCGVFTLVLEVFIYVILGGIHALGKTLRKDIR